MSSMTLAASLASSDRLAFRDYQETIVHLFTECPEGKLIGIARREAVTDQTALQGLELCAWCQSEDRAGSADQDDART
jgi:hypothetical protein